MCGRARAALSLPEARRVTPAHVADGPVVLPCLRGGGGSVGLCRGVGAGPVPRFASNSTTGVGGRCRGVGVDPALMPAFHFRLSRVMCDSRPGSCCDGGTWGVLSASHPPPTQRVGGGGRPSGLVRQEVPSGTLSLDCPPPLPRDLRASAPEGTVMHTLPNGRALPSMRPPPTLCPSIGLCTGSSCQASALGTRARCRIPRVCLTTQHLLRGWGGWGGSDPPPPLKCLGKFLSGSSANQKSPRREVVGSSAGAGVVFPPFWGSFA